MTQYLLSKFRVKYLVSEHDKLTEDGEGFQILCEGPSVVANERFVERAVEEKGQDSGQTDEVVGFDGI
jgi:hypothetical protein